MAEATEMGRVTVTAKIENLSDRYLARNKVIDAADIRSLVIEDALVDTGATRLSLPVKMIEELGLEQLGEARVSTAAGKRTARLFSAVHLSVNGRYCIIDVSELPDDCPVLIGQVPLELMDWVVDMKGQKLIGNPEHDGEWMSELWTFLD